MSSPGGDRTHGHPTNPDQHAAVAKAAMFLMDASPAASTLRRLARERMKAAAA